MIDRFWVAPAGCNAMSTVAKDERVDQRIKNAMQASLRK